MSKNQIKPKFNYIIDDKKSKALKIVQLVNGEVAEDMMKSFSSPLADELNFANEKNIKEKIYIKKNKVLENISQLSASIVQDFKALKDKFKEQQPSKENPKCCFGKKFRRLFCRLSHRHVKGNR